MGPSEVYRPTPRVRVALIVTPRPLPPLRAIVNHNPSPSPDVSMTDLTAVLPDFPTQGYARILPSLEKNQVTVADLLTQDCIDVAKRAQVPLLDVKRLAAAILHALQTNLGLKEPEDDAQPCAPALRRSGKELFTSWNTISTLDDDLDSALGGGIPTGYITEITGERLVAQNQMRKTNANQS